MIIEHSNFHRWEKKTFPDPLDYFGKNNRSRIRSTLNRIDEYDISYEIKPLDNDFFVWFKPLYEHTITQKQNAKVHDIVNTTLYRTENPRQYYTLALYENGQPTGGTIFSFFNNSLSIAYRVYENEWREAKLPANPSFYTEYLICKHAHEQKVPKISHGKDRNPYGLNANIGLATYKLTVGCHPLLPEAYELIQTDTTAIQTDALIMQLPEKSTENIRHALLVTSRETEHKYSQLFKYPDKLQVSIEYRD